MSDLVMHLLTDMQGTGINFANIQNSPVYPIIYAKSAKKSGVDENATRCLIIEANLFKQFAP